MCFNCITTHNKRKFLKVKSFWKCFTQYKITHRYKHSIYRPTTTNPHHTRDLYKMFLYTLFHTVLMFSSLSCGCFCLGVLNKTVCCGCFCYSWIFSCFVLSQQTESGRWKRKSYQSVPEERERGVKQDTASITSYIPIHTHTHHYTSLEHTRLTALDGDGVNKVIIYDSTH